MRIYLANLGKYNEGELVGKWFDLPIYDIVEALDEIGVKLGTQYEEYAIHDYELPFEIGEYTSISKLNEVITEFDDMSEHEIKAVGAILDDGIADDFEDAIRIAKEETVFYFDCKDMSDVAEEYMDSTGLIDQLPEGLRYYFDYEKLGRDMEIEGTYIYLGEEIFVQVLS